MSAMVEVKTADLIGPALDWAVAKAAGIDVSIICPPIINEDNQPALLTNKGLWAAGKESPRIWSPSTDWSQGGPLIEKFEVSVEFMSDYEPGGKRWCDANCSPLWTRGHPSPLIAACRAIVASRLGGTVQVPAELLPGGAQ